MKYEFIETHKAAYKITEICECFSIKPSGYYAWLIEVPVHEARLMLSMPHASKSCTRHLINAKAIA